MKSCAYIESKVVQMSLNWTFRTSETARRNESPNTIGKRLSMEEKKCKTLQTEYRELNLQHQKSKESLSNVEEEKQKLEDKINLLNSYGTERGKCVEIVKTLHVKFFPSGSLLPNGPVAVKPEFCSILCDMKARYYRNES